MPLNTDLNVSPYFDDYDETKHYHRVLFRPDVAVQARELTQLQTILQNQIERFGTWAFKNGDIVSGCEITDIPSFPYIRLADFASNGASYDVSSFVNTVVTSATSNLQARVIVSNTGLAANYPNTMVAYIQYLNTGTAGQREFSNNEQLTFKTVTVAGNSVIATVNSLANSVSNTFAVGNAHGVSIGSGIIFINGHFVRVENPTVGLVNPTDTNAGNNVVGFQLSETIVTENQDESLNDNALGYSNENAPGAHRLKLDPVLTALDPVTAANTDGFNPVAVYNFGSLVSKAVASVNVYSIIGDAIERRTYEESGNYVVNPFVVDTITTSNSIVSSLDANNVLGRISPGVGYAQGARVEIQKTSYINMRRGVDTAVNQSAQITFNYGGYLQLQEVAGSFDFTKAANVTFYDTVQKAVTNRSFGTVAPVGNVIGTASLRCYSYSSGLPGSKDAIYNLHVFNVVMANNRNVADIKSVYYGGTVKGYGDVISNGLVAAGNKDQLYTFGVPGLKSLRDSANNNSSQYVYRTRATSTMFSNGQIVVTLPASATGGTDILPFGTGVLPDSDASTFSVIVAANNDSAALTGTVAITGANTVTGTGTTFTSDFVVGDQIKVNSVMRTVTAVPNNTFLAIDVGFGTTLSGQAYSKSYVTGRILPLGLTLAGASSWVNVTNSTSFSINTAQKPSATIAVEVVHDVLRTNVTPRSKVIKKNRFVKIDTRSNPQGPWCLGMSDIHRLRHVYGTSNGSYVTTGSDITTNFVFDHGQKDTHYDLGYLQPQRGYDTSANPYLLVELDYFAANTSPGVGFYTVESYPIDDTNAANTNAIQTQDIPLYVDEAGRKLPLRDYVDFRPVATPTATDTTDPTTATLNPSNILTLNVPASGLNVPSYAKNFQADYTYYVPRKDLVYITASNAVKIKQGAPSLTPQTPLAPDNAMAIAVINIPAYPSLSTDQLDALLALNKSSVNLIRDTSTAISSSLVTNRRYTMRDIGLIDKRVTNLEYYQSLSLLEKKAADMTVTDANGLDRFKNGIFAEPFSDFSFSEVSNPEYSIAIDTSKGIARPRVMREVIRVSFNNSLSTNIQQTGRCLTLPYTEVEFLSQPYATKYRSSAHVAFAWNGTCILMPNYDGAIDVNNTGSINFTVDNTTAWKDFAKSPYGSTWGDWRTTTTSESTTVGAPAQLGPDVLNLDFQFGFIASHDTPLPNITKDQVIAVMVANGLVPPADFVIGSVSNKYTVADPSAPAGALNVTGAIDAKAFGGQAGGGGQIFFFNW